MSRFKKYHNASGKGYDKYTDDSKFKAASRLRTIDSWQKADRKASRERAGGVLTLIIIVLLVVSIIGVLNNAEILTFKGLLEFLQGCPSFELDLLALPQIPTVHWGIFQVLAGMINGVIFLINALTFILMAITNALAIILWFLKFVFL